VTRYSLDVLCFDELVVGDEWESPGRTVTETDVVLFAGLSGTSIPFTPTMTYQKADPLDVRWPMAFWAWPSQPV